MVLAHFVSQRQSHDPLPAWVGRSQNAFVGTVLLVVAMIMAALALLAVLSAVVVVVVALAGLLAVAQLTVMASVARQHWKCWEKGAPLWCCHSGED